VPDCEIAGKRRDTTPIRITATAAILLIAVISDFPLRSHNLAASFHPGPTSSRRGGRTMDITRGMQRARLASTKLNRPY